MQPLIEKVKGYLTEAGLEYAELGGVVPNPRLSKVYEGIEMCRKEKCDCVLAVGRRFRHRQRQGYCLRRAL